MNLGEDSTQIPRKRFRQYQISTEETENKVYALDPNFVGYQLAGQSQVHPPSIPQMKETVNETHTYYQNYPGYQHVGLSQMHPPHHLNSEETEDKTQTHYHYHYQLPIVSNHVYSPCQVTESREDETHAFYPTLQYEHIGGSQMHHPYQVKTEEAPNFYPNATEYQSPGGSQMSSPQQVKKETKERTRTGVSKFAGYQPIGGSQMFQRHLLQMRKEAIEDKMRTLDPKFPKHEHIGRNQMSRKFQLKEEEEASETHLMDPNFGHMQDSQMDQTKKEETDDEVHISDPDFSGSVGIYKMHRKTEIAKKNTNRKTYSLDSSFPGASHTHHKIAIAKKNTNLETYSLNSSFPGASHMRCKSRMGKEETGDETHTLDYNVAEYEHVGVSQMCRKSEVREVETETDISDPNCAEYEHIGDSSRMHRKSQLMNNDTEYRTLDPNFSGYQLVGDSQMVRFGEQLLALQRMTTPTKKIEDEIHTLDPSCHGYQLVGDSQMVRFGEQILGLQRLQTPTKSGRIGICVSGQTISELHKRVKQKFYPIDKKIVLMIGTNDFLRNAEVSTMCHDLSSLVKSLQESAQNIVILTLPPVPKLSFKEEHWTKLDKYNKHILSLDNGKSIVVGDIAPLFYSVGVKRCRLNLFELYFSGSARRKDLIHLNFKGLQLIRNYILDYL